MSLRLARLWLSVMAASPMIGLAAPTVVIQATDTDLEAVQVIEKMGGRVERAKADPGMPVVRVELNGTKATDAVLAHLKKFPALLILDLRGTQVTDDGLRQLEGCKTLTYLGLDFTQVTDAGLAQIKGLTSLRQLSLNNTQVTDAGLAHLEGHKTLAVLGLDFTQVSDAGLAQIKRLPSLSILSLVHTKITDAGLASLKGLTGLVRLDLSRTQVTDAGLLAIRQALPRARVEFNRMARGDPDGEREFITYLRDNGVEAERDLSGWSDSWRVVRPATKDYSVEFVLIFFPTEATAEQMNNELNRISLGMLLNAPAHLAMSFPSYRAPKVPDSGFPNAQQDPTCNRIKELFNQYKRRTAESRKDQR
jgi:Leucine Rich repeat